MEPRGECRRLSWREYRELREDVLIGNYHGLLSGLRAQSTACHY